jgi:hypothetical protein
MFEKLRPHVGHKVEVVTYGDDEQAAIECLTCCEVLVSADR